MHFCVCIFLLCISLLFPAVATEIQLKNGTVYNGTIEAEDDSFYSLKVARKILAINKSLIATLDGRDYQPAQNTIKDATTKQTTPLAKKSVDFSSSTEKKDMLEGWKVLLSNGSVFTGKRMSENKRILVLESKGVPVTIFKNMIASIDSGKILSGAGALPARSSENAVYQTAKTQSSNSDASVISPRQSAAAGAEQTAPSTGVTVIALQTPEKPTVPQSPAPRMLISGSNDAPAHSTEVSPVDGKKGNTTVTISKNTQKFTTAKVEFNDDNKPDTAPKAIGGTDTPSDAVSEGTQRLPPPRSRMTMVAFAGEESAGSEAPVDLSQNTASTTEGVVPSTKSAEPSTTAAPISDSDGIKVYTAPLPAFVKARRKMAPPIKNDSVHNVRAPVSIKSDATLVSPAETSATKNISRDSAAETNVKTQGPSAQNVEVIPQLQVIVPPQRDAVDKAGVPSSAVSENELGAAIGTTAPMPLPMAAASPPKPYVKRHDGKREILLASGTRFIGTIQSDGRHSLAFAVDGAVITILKRLIKEIDGEPYTYEKIDDSREDAVASATRAQSTMKKQQVSKAQQVLFRIMPTVELSAGATVESLIDSMEKSTNWRTCSKTIRMLGAMGPWGISAIPAVSRHMGDTAMNAFDAPLYLDSLQAEELLPPGLEAARTLAQLGNQGVSELMKAFRSNNVLLRRNAVFGFGNCFYDAAVRSVKEALSDNDPEIRRMALASLRIPDAQPFLMTACKDRDPKVRAAAVVLLGKLESESARPQVLKMAHDKNSLVRAMVAGTLAGMGTVKELPLLETLCKDKDNFVRAAAVRALGSIEDSSAVDLCIVATRDSSAEVRLGAVDALEKIKNSRSIPTLYSLVKDPHQQVREMAAGALRAHTEIPLLIAALDAESPMKRANVAYILWLLTAQPFAQDKAQWEVWAAQQADKNNPATPKIATHNSGEK